MGIIDVPELLPGFIVETPETVVTLALSGDQLAVGTAESEISILDRHTGGVMHTLTGHAGGTNSLVYAAGTRLISAGEDGKAAIWDIEKGTQLESLEVEGLDADT
jgi:WD40 repeat protein